MEANNLAVITVVKGTQVNKCVKHFNAKAEASTTLGSGALNWSLFVATFSKLWVKFVLIMGSEESEELSSLVNEGEGEGGGVAEPETRPSQLWSRPRKYDIKDSKTQAIVAKIMGTWLFNWRFNSSLRLEDTLSLK